MLNLLFHRKKKLNKSERDRAHDSYIALAVRSGFVEQRDGNYEITEYGFKTDAIKPKMAVLVLPAEVS